MTKRQALSPTEDRVTTRLRWSSVKDQTGQVHQQEMDFYRIFILVPFLRVTDRRQSADGEAEVKMECNTWVNRGCLEKLVSGFKQLEGQLRLIDEDLYIRAASSQRGI